MSMSMAERKADRGWARLVALITLSKMNDSEDHYCNFPEVSVEDLRDLIDRAGFACYICGRPLSSRGLGMGPHDVGVPVRGYHERQWVYVHCDGCKHDWALWKLLKLFTRLSILPLKAIEAYWLTPTRYDRLSPPQSDRGFS